MPTHGTRKDAYAVAREETVNISCKVDSDPTDLFFRWALNNSVENVELTNYKSTGVISIISFTPKSTSDYGVLQCWGKNPVGELRNPCATRIIHDRTLFINDINSCSPDPVRNCVVVNRSPSSLLVQCEPGYSNGLMQRFHLDVYNSAVDHLQVNLTSHDSPTFSVQDLPAGTPFVLVVYASNEKGKSNTLAIVGNTLASPLEDEGGYSDLVPLVPILLASFVTILMMIAVGLAFIQIWKKRPRKSTSIEENKSKFDDVLKKTAEDIEETTIACPHVVPPNNSIYVSPDGESMLEMPKHINAQDYKDCVVALKRSWSIKTGIQEKVEVEVTLPDLNSVTGKLVDSPTALSPLLGDVTIKEGFTNKKILIKVEPPPNADVGMKQKNGHSYRTDSI